MGVVCVHSGENTDGSSKHTGAGCRKKEHQTVENKHYTKNLKQQIHGCSISDPRPQAHDNSECGPRPFQTISSGTNMCAGFEEANDKVTPSNPE